MGPFALSNDDKSVLLKIAREAIQAAANHGPMPWIELDEYSYNLKLEGASFVTLTIDGQLRGCIGTLEAYQPLVLDVQEHAIAAANQDYRFPPVEPQEVPLLEIEISHLTPTQLLDYNDFRELISLIRPGIDGVLIKDNMRRATFLPQVWEKIPQPEEFLTHLCHKMGAPGDLWRKKRLEVYVYQVEEFKEE